MANFWGSAVGRMTGHLAVAAGIMQEVSDQDEGSANNTSSDSVKLPAQPSAGNRVQPSLPTHLAAVTVSRATTEDSAAAVKARFEKDLEAALQATPPKFHGFLEQKEVLMDTLRDSVPEEKLEEAATKAALKVTKLNSSDVAAAMVAARAALASTKGDFASWKQEQVASNVDAPNREIGDAEAQVKSLRTQIAELEGRATALQTGIDPKRQAIAQAQAEVARAEDVFKQAAAGAESALAAMEQQLSNRLAK